MDELTLDNKIYISSKRAATLTGYAKDYVGQLCREGRVEARLVGRSWYVLEDSIRSHRFGDDDTLDSVSIKTNEKQEEKKQTTEDSIEKDTKYNVDFEHIYFPDDAKMVEEDSEVVSSEEQMLLGEEAEDIEPTEPISAMQDVWKEWFEQNGKQKEESVVIPSLEPASVTEEKKPYLLDSSEEVETKEENVPLHIVHKKEEQRSIVAVDYMAPLQEKRSVVVEEIQKHISTPRPDPKTKSRTKTSDVLVLTERTFLGLKASLLGVILISVSITMIALGLFRPIEPSNQPIYLYISGETKL